MSGHFNVNAETLSLEPPIVASLIITELVCKDVSFSPGEFTVGRIWHAMILAYLAFNNSFSFERPFEASLITIESRMCIGVASCVYNAFFVLGSHFELRYVYVYM